MEKNNQLIMKTRHKGVALTEINLVIQLKDYTAYVTHFEPLVNAFCMKFVTAR